MNRIQNTFVKLKEQDQKALITYLVVGDPDVTTTLELMNTMVDEGADILELGISFSDPMAEGPSIQKAHERALEEKTTLNDALDVAKEFRKNNSTTPIVFMGYMNPFEAMGAREFCKKAKECGVDGILLVDMPPEESGEFSEYSKVHGIDIIRLIAPTTDNERVEKICLNASGYIYYISVKGITGSGSLDFLDIEKKVHNLKLKTDIPVVIGFGIKDSATVDLVKNLSDGIVVGSVLVDLIAEGKDGVTDKIAIKMKELTRALLN